MFEVMVFLTPGSLLVVYFGGYYLRGVFVDAKLGHLLVAAYSLALAAAVVYGLIALWVLSLAYMDRTEWPEHVWGGWKCGDWALSGDPI